MVSELKRAYVVPGQYCIFYQHRLILKDYPSLDEYNTAIGDAAVARLKYALEVQLGTTDIPLFTQLMSDQLKVVRIHTVDPHRGEADLFSCIALELPAPVTSLIPDPFTWTQLHQGLKEVMPPFGSIEIAQQIYDQLRLDVLRSVATIYDPTFNTSITYTNAYSNIPGDVNGNYYARQREIIAMLRDPAQPDFDNQSINAISANWVVAPSPNSPPPVDSGGPGSMPANVTAMPAGDLGFSDPAIGPWWTFGPTATPPPVGRTTSVHVAVFDSVPAYEHLDMTSQNRGNHHPLMTTLLGQQGLAESTIPNIAELGGPVYETEKLHLIYDHEIVDGGSGTLPPAEPPDNTDPAVVRRHGYLMPDHGLFVGGIISAIEPSAHIYLIQVLNDYGVGTLESLWVGFAKYWHYWYLKYANGVEDAQVNMQNVMNDFGMVFNCSLGFDAPPIHDIYTLESIPHAPPVDGVGTADPANYYAKLGQDMANDELYQTYMVAVKPDLDPVTADYQYQYMAQLWPSFDGLRRLFEPDFFNIERETASHPFDLQHRNLHLLTAAAGNNRTVDSPHPSALFPASDPVGIGVGALQTREPSTDENIAEYSNIADTPPEDGLYVFGGTAPRQPTDPDEASPVVTADQGIISLYLGLIPNPANPEAPGIPTSFGLAEWAGTSFATPIVSGILAALLARGNSHPMLSIYRIGHSEQLQKDENDVPIMDANLAAPLPAPPTLPMQVIHVMQNR